MSENKIIFDESRAKRYDPLGVRDPGDRVLKACRLVEKPDGNVSVIVPEWGGEQRFLGSYYEILNQDGTVSYGSAKAELEDTHTLAPLSTIIQDDAEKDGVTFWYKTAPVDAYQTEEAGTIFTVLADGTEETVNEAKAEDWVVRQKGGEFQRITRDKFPTLYDLKTERPVPIRVVHLTFGWPGEVIPPLKDIVEVFWDKGGTSQVDRGNLRTLDQPLGRHL